MFFAVFFLCLIVFGFVAFFGSPTGLKLIQWLNKKNYEREMQKADPFFEEELKARQKTVQNLKGNAEYQAAYNQYLATLKRGEFPLSYEDFISNYLDSLAGVGKFTLHIDLYGNIESVELEGYGEVPLEMVKELEPRAYAQIMAEYEKFKRERNFKD